MLRALRLRINFLFYSSCLQMIWAFFLTTRKSNFQEVKKVIEAYERISGAKLSLPKSLIMKLDSKPTSEWFSETGCQVAVRGQFYKYLGCPIGINLSRQSELDFVIDKVRKKLRHWSHKLLSMAGRAIYIKHILRVVLVYSLMIFDFSKAGMNRLKTLPRKFLWSFSAEGRAKKALIACDVLARPKVEGGLEFHTFASRQRSSSLDTLSRS
jgi:hypothetical protein